MAEIIGRSRFELALERLAPSDWERFEKLASTFLASEWPDIRTVASPSGDDGRDAELFSPANLPKVMIQYSVQKDWQGKVRKTIKRISENFPGVTSIIYLTNQTIGAAADSIKADAFKEGIMLDVRDMLWFAERVNTSDSRAAAAEDLARAIVDPFLQVKTVVKRTGNALTAQEAKTALVFLEMQLSDEKKEKGLTRSAFEAFVKGALNESTPDSRVTRTGIHEQVAKFLPKHSPGTLAPFVDSALNRLNKSVVRHYAADDSFCLSHEELLRLKNVSAEIQILNDDFDRDVLEIAHSLADVRPEMETSLLECIRTVVGRYFLEKGEEFASAIASDAGIRPTETEMGSIVISTVPGEVFAEGQNNADLMLRIINLLLSDSSEATLDYLKLLSDSYTLFAFLEETPDVQKSTRRLFGEADVWLDTSVLLPVFAESIFPVGNRPFTTAFKQSRRASLRLFVTSGVIEEIYRHLKLCEQFVHTPRWEGRIPYVMSQFLLAGKKALSFPHWVENFIGRHNPEQDIADYLYDEFGVEVKNDVVDAQLDADVQTAVKEYWSDIQDRRRSSGDNFNMAANRLAAHDAENYLLVLRQRKRNSGRSPLGFTSWWLTMDHAAWKMPERLPSEVWEKIRFSPLMSIDFLLKYLAFGPNRERVDHGEISHPYLFGSHLLEVPPELIEVANTVRSECGSLPERIIQRRIRDAMDSARTKTGPVQSAGLDGAAKAITDLF